MTVEILESHNIGLLIFEIQVFFYLCGEGTAKFIFKNDFSKTGGHTEATSSEKRSLAKQSHYSREELPVPGHTLFNFHIGEVVFPPKSRKNPQCSQGEMFQR